MTYPQTIQYLESFINYEKISVYPYKKSLKLERIKGFLATLDNPQDSLRCIHIAGTKGKGSTCVFITYILRAAGYKVGLYTSPHLSDFRERIRILKAKPNPRIPNPEFEGMILKAQLIKLVERIKASIGKYNQISKYGPLSFFEVYTSLAFIYFKEQKVDFVVLETGLGGRLDATNVVNPLICAIAPISYEHTEKLGSTLTDIATEKAGIIKAKRTPIVISAPQEKGVIQVIKKRCQKIGARLYEVGKDITYRKTKNRFNVNGIFKLYPGLKIRLFGEHQLINATVAVGVTEALNFFNIDVGIDSIRGGLYNTLWPGRCEVVSRNPLVVLDGAQNVASSKVLKEAIKENFAYKKLILTLGISKDKDIKGICNELKDLADEVVLTKASNPRAAEPKIIAKHFYHKKVYITHSVEEAKAWVLRMAKKEDLILVCGSLFVVGEFRDGGLLIKDV